MKRLLPYCLALILIFTGCSAQTEPDPELSSSSEPSTVDISQEVASPTEESAEEEAPPDNNWEIDTPENHGMDGELLNQLHEAAEEVNIFSIVTIKDGYLVDEYYKADYDENSVIRIASCTKSFSGALIGIAIDQGLIPSVDIKISEYFPQIADSDDALKKDITLEHLLTQTSGIEWNEWNGGTTFGEMRRSENWVDFVLEKPMAAEPGSTFNYSTGGSHLLSAIIQEASGMTEFEFAKEYLFKPLGMDSVTWAEDPQGISDGGNGIGMNTRDAAKFGQLFLNGGNWKGQQIIPEKWVEDSVKIQFERSGQNGSYGYQWWIRPFGEGNYDTYFAMGHGGHYIFVVPELELVTVMTCRFNDTYDTFPYFADYVLAACG